jgi:NAD(P)-dependent dehydrogenase (short-subunit alcohol dehydrogenase family)
VSDVNSANAQNVVNGIIEAGGNALVVKSDVTKYKDVENLINSTVGVFGRLDVIVNNAGIGPKRMVKVADHTLEDWDKVIAVNQTGVFYCMKLAIAQMLKNGGGNIVNVASLAGLKASGKNLSYSASKFAVVGMTKSAALEYANDNIRVNAVCPGYTKSALLDQLLKMRDDMDKLLLRFVPMRRFGEAKEIAEAIVFLASDNTRFITGQTITLDGGASL